MNREIKISRTGKPGMWHNPYINQIFTKICGETGESLLIETNEGQLWIDKQYVDIRTDQDKSWVSGVKYSTPQHKIQETTKTEVEILLENPLLKSMLDTFDRCLNIAVKKNNDYGGSDKNPFSNFTNAQVAGVSVERGILVRLMDKMSRISTLLDKEAMVKNESINDTIEDAINYLAILKAYINQK